MKKDFTTRKAPLDERVLSAAKKAGLDPLAVRYATEHVRSSLYDTSGQWIARDLRDVKCRVNSIHSWSCRAKATVRMVGSGRDVDLLYTFKASRKKYVGTMTPMTEQRGRK